MKYISLVLALLVSFSSFSCVSYAEEDVRYYYVSTDGDDSNPGTKEAPFATIYGAKEAVRNSSDRTKKKIEVIFEEGTYKIDKSVLFERKDSGASGKPVIYRAADGAKVRFDGGTVIGRDKLKSVDNKEILDRLYPEVRDKVKVIDLKELGVTSVADIEMTDHFFRPEICPVTFYCGDQEMDLARFPNKGNNQYVKTGKVIIPGSKTEIDPVKTPGAFTYLDERIEKWKDIQNVWMWGEWNFQWAPSTTPIDKLDTEANVLYTKYFTSYSYVQDRNYYYFNVLEELDVPGEYYIDRQNCLVYLYPPEKFEDEDMFLTSLTEYMININGGEYLRFKDVSMESTRNTAVYLKDAKDIIIDGCTIKNVGVKAVHANSGSDIKIINNEIYNTGYGAIAIGPDVGNYEYLISGNSLIENNHIYNFSQWQKTTSQAIKIEGVGTVARHNTVHGTPHLAIAVDGINSVFEYNEVYMAFTDNDDGGAIYSYMSGYGRNNTIRYNYIHGIARRMEKTGTGSWAMYFDGFNSNKNVYGNIIKDVPGGLHINSGQNIKFYSNLLIDCDTPVWGHIFNSHGPYDFWKTLRALPYDRGIWKQTFPEASVMQDDPNEVYRNNYVNDNICYDCGVSFLEDVRNNNDLHEPKYYKAEEDIFVDLENDDWTLKVDHGIENFYVPNASEIGIREERVIYE